MKRRRRSVLLASALTLSAGLSACEPKQEQQAVEQPMTVYASKEECATAQDWGACDAAFTKAKAEHDQTAPKFASRAECEAAIGPEGCEERHASSGGSFFMPMMMGMMMGRMMSGPSAYPVYTDRQGAAYTGGARVSNPDPRYGAGAATRTPRSLNVPVTPSGAIAPSGKTTRSGFGQTASYRGSAGG